MNHPPLPIDWPRLLEDIAWQLGEPDFAFPHVRTPAGTPRVAAHLRISRSTLLRWRDGSEPRHCDGEWVVMVWCQLTGKSAAFVPRAKRSLSASEMR